MAKLSSAGVLVAFVAAAVVSGCEKDQSTAPSAHASTGAPSSTPNDSSQRSALTEADQTGEQTGAEAEQKPAPEWTIDVTGPLATNKRGHTAAYTYLDQALHMRLLYNPSVKRFGQGLTFHVPDLALGYEGPAEASYARLEFGDEGLVCSTKPDDADTSFSVELSEFSRDLRVGTFEGRMVCRPQSDDEEPKYVAVSGRFQHD